MGKLIYALCMLTSLGCTILLLRSYLRSRYRLLFWSGLCFAGLTINNLLLLADKLSGPAIDLSTWRLVTALAALIPLLYGLIWEE
ncbi:MAG TPA: DUF5985 family protein [Oxalicibacterium sp.]|nr:DUF5985 family protein [Oxalicibacterium sp.]